MGRNAFMVLKEANDASSLERQCPAEMGWLGQENNNKTVLWSKSYNFSIDKRFIDFLVFYYLLVVINLGPNDS